MCSRLELCRWINSNTNNIRNILFTDEVHFTRDEVNNTRSFHLWDLDNPHGTVESNYQHFPQRLIGDIYANILQDELPTLLENVPLQT